jgi:hypothetical protein
MSRYRSGLGPARLLVAPTVPGLVLLLVALAGGVAYL